MTQSRLIAVVMLLTLAILAIWFVLYALFFSSLRESHSQHVLYTRLRTYLASEITPFGGAIRPGTPVMLISAPEIGLHAVVIEGTTSAELAKGPGHFAASPFPGQAGTSVIFGRSATFGGPFGKITKLHAGDPITLVTGQGEFHFHVLDVRRSGDRTPSPALLGASSVALETAAGSGWRSGWAPSQAVVIDAALNAGTKVQPAPAGQPTTVSAASLPLAGDTGDLVPLVLWLQAIVLVAAGLTYAATKWSIGQLWLVGAPTVLAVLWGATSAALLLLPNLG